MHRILYVEANEDDTVGGSHKILFDLVTRLTAHEPLVLFYEDNIWARRLRERGISVVTWEDVRSQEQKGFWEGGKLSTARTLVSAIRHRSAFIREAGVDLVHLNNSPFIGPDLWIPATGLAGVPCVSYGMGSLGYDPSSFRRWLMSRFDAYFPLSRIVQNAHERNGMPSERMTLTYPGVDFEEADARTFRPADEVRAEFDLREGQLLVTMVGNIREWKGQHVVVEGLSGLSESERARLRVLFVGQRGEGDIEYAAGLEAAIEAYGLGDTVEFTGRREDVPDLLEASDIAIHASVAPEPFGLVVQEAMLHGCATIAANEGGPVEMMTPDSGFMFDTGKPEELTAHLRRLIADDELRDRIAAAARVQARTFDVHHHVKLIEDRYRELLA